MDVVPFLKRSTSRKIECSGFKFFYLLIITLSYNNPDLYEMLTKPTKIMKARLKDVAERAGVATNTASTILNRRPNSWASKETAARVFKATEDLGYRPNRAALGLRLYIFNTVGLVIPDLHNPVYTTFAD